MKAPYETMFLLPAATVEDQVDALIARLKESAERKSGEITAIDKKGVKRTAFAINKQYNAYYVIMQYNGTGETVAEIEKHLKNNDAVLKLLTTKVITKVAKPVKQKKQKESAAPKPAPEPVSAE
jgi:small subunit ribosomal protein S6